MRVFFSHSSRDKPLLREIKRLLPGFLNTWIDEDHLLIGADLGTSLQSAISEQSDFVVIFISEEAATSKWVRQELAWALEREKTLGTNFILPVLLSTKESLVDDLGLQGRLFLRCGSYNTADIENLARKLSDHLFHWAIIRLEAAQASPHPLLPANGDAAFDAPNVLVVFDHAAPDQDDGSYVLSALKVMTIRALRDGDIEIHTKRSSTGTIVSSELISNPVTGVSYGVGTPQGGTKEVLYNARAGEQFVEVTESERRIRVGDRSSVPDDVPVLASLHTHFLLSPLHAYSGTRTVAPTERVRLLCYFNGPNSPKRVNSVLIEASGEVSGNKTRLEYVPEKSLYVVEADDVPAGAGLYAYWKWPEEAKAKPRDA